LRRVLCRRRCVGFRALLTRSCVRSSSSPHYRLLPLRRLLRKLLLLLRRLRRLLLRQDGMFEDELMVLIHVYLARLEL
jgi:hypothetical protein